MSKAEFLKILEERLSMLEEQERKDMLSEYSQHIDMKMKSGMGEDEAIDDFGDVNHLIGEILEAYHIDPKYEAKDKKQKNGIADGVFTKSKYSISNLFGQKKEKRNNTKRDAENVSTSENIKDVEEGIDDIPEEKVKRQAKDKKKKKEWNLGKKVHSLEERLGSGVLLVMYLFLKVVLFIIVIPAMIADLFAIFGLGAIVILLLQGYPLFGACVSALGIILCCSSYSIFIWTYIMKRRPRRNRKEVLE